MCVERGRGDSYIITHFRKYFLDIAIKTINGLIFPWNFSLKNQPIKLFYN